MVPWIKKNKNGVIFTTQVIDAELITEESVDLKREEKYSKFYNCNSSKQKDKLAHK